MTASSDTFSTDGDALPDRADAPPPRVTATGVGLAGLGWIFYALFYAFFVARQAPEAPFVGILIGQLLFSLILGTYSLPVWGLTVRAMDAWHWGWKAAAHLGIAPLYAWAGLDTYILVIRAMAGAAIAGEVTANYQWIFFGTLTVYAVQFTIYHLVRSVQQLRWREQQAAELAAVAREQELAALKAQINPHFLFNTLNSISATVHTAPEEARTMIADLSDLLRYALRSTEQDRVPLRREIQFAQSYLDLEAQRFSDRLTVRYDIDAPSDALDVSVPPMILQPLAENAITHGIAPREDGGTVALRVHVLRGGDEDGTSENAANGDTNVRLRVCVEDTGVGPSGTGSSDDGTSGAAISGDATSADKEARNDLSGDGNGTGVGLANTDRRLQHAFGPTAALHTEPVTPHGFRVWFDVPLGKR